MTGERRRAPRFSLEQVIEMSYGHESFVNARGVNISKTGLLCTSDSYLEPYTTVVLTIKVPSGPEGQILNCEGIVIRSTEENGGYTTAISFMSFRGQDAETLNAFLGERESLNGE